MSKSSKTIPVALTIAGSDSGGGAGIQGDLKVFAALGAHGTSAITAITAQNPSRVARVFPVEAKLVTAQIAAVFDAFDVGAVKCGMLGTEENVAAVATLLRRKLQTPNSKHPRNSKFQAPQLVIDPILRATSGATLLELKARVILEEKLLPLATLVTPNLHEASAFLGRRISSLAHMRGAAMELSQRWGTAVLVKGGHSQDLRQATDVFCDGQKAVELSAPRLPGKIHGLGCTTSAAITVFLAQGHALFEAVGLAKAFVSLAIRQAIPVNGHVVLRF